MNKDINDISPNGNADKIAGLQTLNDEISDINAITENEFELDAEEGLKNVPAKTVSNIVSQLNFNLEKELKQKKSARKNIPDQTGVYITIITLLILLVVTYVIISRLL